MVAIYTITFDNGDGFDPKRDVDRIVAKSEREALAIMRKMPYVKAGATLRVLPVVPCATCGCRPEDHRGPTAGPDPFLNHPYMTA